MSKREIRRVSYLPFLTLILGISSCSQDQISAPGVPVLNDPRLQLKLVIETPQIQTPIGLAIDDRDDLYVLESHTHSPESSYPGPKFDRIKKSSGVTKDGVPASWLIFADSIEDGMNLAWHDNAIFLVTKNKVLAFKDINDDGISDERKTLLIMYPPAQVYDHAGLLGIEISADGWIYISRGNVGGKRYKITGSDDSTLENFGDGGNVFRCRLDGSQLEEVATGFWNPFGLEITKKGELWLTDNDPDSRGPNRLVELVMGADFGYRSLYGGSGNHPFSAWNGDLPGTLPYYVGIGEAPCGLIDGSLTNLPSQYNDRMLIAIWEENKIISVPLNHDAGDQVKYETLIQGDSTFHPVAFASNSSGDIYFTDWVVRQYPNHGQGKIWKIEVLKDKQPQEKTSQQYTANIWLNLNPTISADSLINILLGRDQPLKTVARNILSHPDRDTLLARLIYAEQPDLRLQALLTYFHSNKDLSSKSLERLIADPDPDIRKMTLIYIATRSRAELKDKVMASLANEDYDAKSFSIFLETIRHLKPEFILALAQAENRYDAGLTQQLSDDFIMGTIENKHLASPIRALALRHLKNPQVSLEKLISLLNAEKNFAFRDAVIESVRKVSNDTLSQLLISIIMDDEEDTRLRIKCLNALAYQSEKYCDKITPLLDKPDDHLKESVLRHLCSCRQDPEVKIIIENFLTNYAGSNKNLLEIWQLCNGASKERPQSDVEWLTLMDQPGNAAKGKTIFERAEIQCQSCHKIDGWGGDFGPDLSHIGSSKSKEQLVQAILSPSVEIAPEWQGWIVTDSSGVTHLGWQIDVGRHDVEIMNQDGEFITYSSPQKYEPAEASLMPENLENNLTTQDFRDLVSYLISLK